MEISEEEGIRQLHELCSECCSLIRKDSSRVTSLAEQANAKQQEAIAEMRRRDGIGQEEIKRLLTLEDIVGTENRVPVTGKQQSSAEVQRIAGVEKDIRRAMGTEVDQDPPPNVFFQERCADLQKRLQHLQAHSNHVERRVARGNLRLELLKAIAPLRLMDSGDVDVAKGFVAGTSDVANFSVQRHASDTVEPTKELWDKIHAVC